MRAVLINISPEHGKRPHFGKLPFQRLFNFGLLSIASVAVAAGHDVQVSDHHDEDGRREPDVISALRDYVPDVVGLSCISGFSYPSLLSTARQVRFALPHTKIVVGGMDHVGRIPDTVLSEAPEIDAVVSGYGEAPFRAILDAGCGPIPRVKGISLRGRSEAETAPGSPHPMPALNYQCYRDLRALPPSVELARGCPFECSFCVSAGGRLVRRTPVELADQMLQVSIAYDDPHVKIYLEAPLATFDRAHLRRLKQELVGRGIAPTWRAECRVDTLNPDIADDLVESGCRVLDLGLESASPVVLGWMGKAADPRVYLSKGTRTLNALARAGIFSKVNVLIYAGENRTTLAETHDFLLDRRSVIGAIAAGPLYFYPGISGEKRIRMLIDDQGGSVVETDEWRSRHMQAVHPSRELSFEESLELSLIWEREFQTAHGYWHHRRWGYFSPNVTYERFVSAVLKAGVEHFPFAAKSLAGMGMRA